MTIHLISEHVAPSRRGQVTLEYFIIFAVIAALTILGLTAFDENIKRSLQDAFNAAAKKVAN